MPMLPGGLEEEPEPEATQSTKTSLDKLLPTVVIDDQSKGLKERKSAGGAGADKKKGLRPATQEFASQDLEGMMDENGSGRSGTGWRTILSDLRSDDSQSDGETDTEGGGGTASAADMKLTRTETSRAEKPRLNAVRGKNTSAATVSAEHTYLMKHKKEKSMPVQVRKSIMSAITQNRFCSRLDPSHLEEILKVMTYFHFNQGETIVTQGKDGNYFFVLHEGVLEVKVDGNVTNTLLAGNSFGGIALLYNCPRTATVTAKAASGVWGVDGETFRKVMREYYSKRFTENRRYLNNMSVFDGLTSAQKDRIGEIALMEEEVRAGERVIEEGESTTSMYYVKKGELSVYVGAKWNESGQLEGGKKIATLKSGDCFGERAALYGETRSSTVVADVECEILCIGIPPLKEALGDDLEACLQRSFVRSTLSNIPVLSHLSSSQQGKLADAIVVKQFPPGRPVEEDARLIIVVDGTITGKKGDSEVTLARGEFCQDDALLQVEEDGGSKKDKGKGKPSSSMNVTSLKSGPSGCRLALLRKQAMAKALQDFGLAGIVKGGAEEHVIEYVRKVLLAKKVPVFRDLSEDQINNLVSKLVLKIYNEGAKVFQQGEIGRAFFVISSGEVKVSIDGKLIRTLGKGTCFGERAVLFDEPRSATVEVSSPTAELWSLDHTQFRNVLSKEMREELVKRIQLQDTTVSLKSLRHVRMIGAGSFGSVRLVEHRRTKVRYALKRVRKEDGEIPKEVERECDLLAELDHPFILRLVKTFETKSSVYMLTELITGGQLFVQINQRMGVLSRRQAQFYVSSIIIILETLHERGIVYRDLKPENVMLDEQGYVKLVDFGLAKKLDQGTMRTYSLVGTLFYLAPEVIRGNGYGMSVDVWSLGVMFYELVIGRLPFGDGKHSEHDILVAVLEDPLRFPGKYADNAGKKLIQAMLNKRPEHRAGVRNWDEVKSNKFFKSGVTGNLFNRIVGRELEPPVVPAGEEYSAEKDLEGKVTLSDAEELGGSEDAIIARVMDIFRKVKLSGDGRLSKQQLGKVLKVLDAETFNQEAVDRIWKAMGVKPDMRVQLEDFLSWMSTDDGEAFTRALALNDIHD